MKTMRNKRNLLIGLLIVVLIGLGIIGIIVYAHSRYANRMYDSVKEAPHCKVALVFGAGYYKGGRLSQILQDRIDTAVRLYKAKKVDKILLSGDNSTKDYNETQAMFNEAHRQEVAKEDMWRDFGGRDTYDSCYRAKHGWLVKDVILVTQAYHLPRALYCANSLGLDAYGVIADGPYAYKYIVQYQLREIPALALNWFELHILQRSSEIPVTLEPEALN